MARKGYPAEFRRRALDLVAAGKTVAEVARLLEVSDQSIYTWRRQELIDRGELPGLSSAEREELRAARRRIREWRQSWPSIAGRRTRKSGCGPRNAAWPPDIPEKSRLPGALRSGAPAKLLVFMQLFRLPPHYVMRCGPIDLVTMSPRRLR